VIFIYFDQSYIRMGNRNTIYLVYLL